ncbi:hypothetical protein BFJ69_g4689 [Fusarium oxysporum]|uniref:C2H2-type domain-containing protein n=1 Tax=Fusarium oxysporum TaxID=5507 RepID=A0A420NI04_FUSOX|nr:hypothetical protein BFJ69_g4689 [Fusarium oxysporum]
MGLFNDIDIERDFPDHKVKSMVRRSEWAVQQHQGFFPGNSLPNHHQYPTQDGLVDLQAGLSLDSSGSEDDRSESRSEDEHATGTREVVCCGRSWKQGANYRKHYNRKHNRRLNCVFQNNCDYLGADKKDLHRHYWVSHKEYARANKIPDPSGTCKACGNYFSRKDHIPRHLSRSLSCRVKLGLKK